MQDLIELKLYPNRSEIVRIAVKRFLNKELEHDLNLERKEFRELMKVNQIELVSIKEPKKPKESNEIKTKKKVEFRKHSFKPAQKPEPFLKIFPKEYYFNCIISHLNNLDDFIDYEKLSDLIGTGSTHTCTLMNSLKKRAPGLIIDTTTVHPKGYKIDRRVLRKYLKEEVN